MPDKQLLQMIKDAHDHGVQDMQCLPLDEPSTSVLIPPAKLADIMQRGKVRMAELVARENEWRVLPTTKKVHRMRRAIDRRFDGPLHRRTRDPAMFMDGNDDCNIM